MRTHNIEVRLRNLENTTGGNLPLYVPTIYRFGEPMPDINKEVVAPGVIVKDFTGRKRDVTDEHQ